MNMLLALYDYIVLMTARIVMDGTYVRAQKWSSIFQQMEAQKLCHNLDFPT